MSVLVVNPQTLNLEVEVVDGSNGVVYEAKTDGYGTIAFEEKSMNLSDEVLSVRRNVCFKVGKIEDLLAIVQSMNLKPGSQLPSRYRLVVKESTTPFYKGQSPKVYPESSEFAGTVIEHQGLPVYRTVKLTDNPEEHDVTLISDAALNRQQQESLAGENEKVEQVKTEEKEKAEA